MKRLKIIFFFQRKFLLPSLAVSLAMALLTTTIFGGGLIKSTLVSYLFISLLFHYFRYDARGSSNEYYFYNNLGFSKPVLWGSTAAIGLLCLLISAFL